MAPETSEHEKEIPFRELTPEEGYTYLDKLTQRYLGMSAQAFIRTWDAGEFKHQTEENRMLLHLSMLIYARQTPSFLSARPNPTGSG